MACGKTLILPTIANHQSRPECEEILRQTETLGQEVVNEVEASIERKAVHSVDGRGGTEGARHTTTTTTTTTGRRKAEGRGGREGGRRYPEGRRCGVFLPSTFSYGALKSCNGLRTRRGSYELKRRKTFKTGEIHSEESSD
ncbi:hypothetical protein E2C01_008637 [Portunus trituberculatus]|uniref:Uncharacterized protein n=1 Tax=Portunus trituberculatus TaxID=210409 RepID=A0A5B7D4F4_PORTR|nr:hypothetical protein [Portunus trituberculatus]